MIWPKIIEFDRFAFCVFNHLTYDCEISRLLATNMLLSFLKYYTSKKILKSINMKIFWLYFSKIIFQNVEDEETTESLIPFSISTMILTSIFDNYYYWGKKLELYFFYNYIKIISRIKYNTRQRGNFLFDKYYLTKLFTKTLLSSFVEGLS